MASGSFNVSTSNQYVVGRVSWSSTPNTAGNYSDVYAELRMWRTNTGYSTYGTGTWYLTINGNQTSFSGERTFTYDSNTFVISHSVRVYHNADGSMSCGIGWSGGISGVNTLNASSGTAWLDTIPRASQPSLSAGTTALGSAVTIYTNRASSGFTHTISYAYGSIGKTTIATGVTDSTSWTLPTSLANQTPSATGGTGLIYCETYNGGTFIGTREIQFTASVPNTVTFQPTISSVAVAELMSNVTALALGTGKFVQALSNVRFTVSGIAGVFGSTVSTVKITFNGTTYNASVSNGTATWDTGLLGASGTLNYSITCTDSRGYTDMTPITGSITVMPYTAPIIASFTVKRCDINGNLDEIGTYLKIIRNGSASSLRDASNVEKNTLACTVQWSLKGANTWSTMTEYTVSASTTLSMGTGVVKSTKSDFTITNAYDIKYTLTDKFNNTVSTQVITVGTVMMSWGKTGVGIGKVWTQGALDIKGQSFLEGDMSLTGNLNLTGSIIPSSGNLGITGNIAQTGTVTPKFSPILIPNNSNLNSYTASGFYYCPTNVGATSIANTASNQSFSLIVEGHAGTKQTFTEYTNSGSAKMWIRNCYENVWSPWVEIMTSVSLSGDNKTYGGYKWANGLLMVWGRVDGLAPAQNTWNYGNFYTSFPNACVVVVGSYYHNGSAIYGVDIEPHSNSQFKFWQPTFIGGTGQINKLWYIAYGY